MCIVAGSAGPSLLERPVAVTLDGSPIERAATVGAVWVKGVGAAAHEQWQS
jgi:hypothetical protein